MHTFSQLKQQRWNLAQKGHELASDEEKFKPKSHVHGPTTGPQQRVTQKHLLEAPWGKASHLSYQQLAKRLLKLGKLHVPPQRRRRFGVLKRCPTIYSLWHHLHLTHGALSLPNKGIIHQFTTYMVIYMLAYIQEVLCWLSPCFMILWFPSFHPAALH